MRNLVFPYFQIRLVNIWKESFADCDDQEIYPNFLLLRLKDVWTIVMCRCDDDIPSVDIWSFFASDDQFDRARNIGEIIVTLKNVVRSICERTERNFKRYVPNPDDLFVKSLADIEMREQSSLISHNREVSKFLFGIESLNRQNFDGDIRTEAVDAFMGTCSIFFTDEDDMKEF